MRLAVGAGAIAALVMLPGVATASAEKAGPRHTKDGVPSGAVTVRKDVTALRISPWNPRRDTDVRVIVRCPLEATDAIVATSAFNPAGSRRHSRELGIGLDDDGYGYDTETVTFDSRRGVRAVWLKCLKVEVDEHTLVRHIDLISRLDTTLKVRKKIVPSLRCLGVGFIECHKENGGNGGNGAAAEARSIAEAQATSDQPA